MDRTMLELWDHAKDGGRAAAGWKRVTGDQNGTGDSGKGGPSTSHHVRLRGVFIGL